MSDPESLKLSPELMKQAEIGRRQRELLHLCQAMGFALLLWQRLEEEHFRLFVKMLGAPEREICSAVYHSTESFEGRRVMVTRVARQFFKSHQRKQAKDANAQWNEIDKLLKDANHNRNKIAHYVLDYDLIQEPGKPDGSITVQLGGARLRPSSLNMVSRLEGRTPDKQEHNLGSRELAGLMAQFLDLIERLRKLNRALPLPQPQLGEGLLRAFALHADPQDILSLGETLPPISDPSSGQ